MVSPGPPGPWGGRALLGPCAASPTPTKHVLGKRGARGLALPRPPFACTVAAAGWRLELAFQFDTLS